MCLESELFEGGLFMTRTKNILKKGLSLLICTALIVCALPFAFFTEVSAQDSAYIRIADPSTIDDWKNIFSLFLFQLKHRRVLYVLPDIRD